MSWSIDEKRGLSPSLFCLCWVWECDTINKTAWDWMWECVNAMAKSSDIALYFTLSPLSYKQRVSGSSPLTSTKQEKSEPFTKRWWVRIYCFYGKKWKAGDKNREDCWLRQSSWFFMQMHCLRLRFPFSDWQTPLLCYPPHFVFTLCDRCGIAAAIVNSFYCRYKAACIDWYNQLYCMST